MGESGRKTLMSLAGVYLAYVGGKLFLDAMREKPGNYIFMMIMGIIFVVFGVGTVIMYMRGVFKHEKIEEDTAGTEESTEPEETVDEEVSEQPERKKAVYVNLADMQVSEPETEAALEENPEEAPVVEETAKEPVTEMTDTEETVTEEAEAKEAEVEEPSADEDMNKEESEEKL